MDFKRCFRRKWVVALVTMGLALSAAGPACYVNGIPVSSEDVSRVAIYGLDVIRDIAIADAIYDHDDDDDDDYCEHHHCGPVIVDYYWW